MAQHVSVITHTPTLRHYVGKAKDPKRRWGVHVGTALGRSKRPKQHIHDAIAKHGVDQFSFQVIESFETEAEAYEAESFWIEFLRSASDKDGFNIALGGLGGMIPGDRVRAKISATHKGRVLTPEHKAKIGAASRRPRRPLSAETKAKIGEANRGRRASAETLARMSKAATGRRQTAESIEKIRRANLGSIRSPEVCAKISAAKKGRPRKALSAEGRASLSRALMGHVVSKETGAKIAAGHARRREARSCAFLEVDIQ
jgi:group I intron endonuclease